MERSLNVRISIDKESRKPVYWQIENQIKSKILKRELIGGMKLPSERFLSGMLGIHRNTVTHAYNELKAQGLIESKHGVGYIVAKGDETKTSKKRGNDKVNWHHAIKNEYLDYESTFDDIFISNQEKGVISFGGGMASTEIFSEGETAKIFKDILSSKEGKSQYFTPYKGDRTLRRELVSFLSTKGIHASESNIQVMSEMNQALDFIATVLIEKGDCVLLQEPVSPDVYRTFEFAGADVFIVPNDEDGIVTEDLEGIIQLKKPKLIFVTSGFNDPTGAVIKLERRKDILRVSNKYRIPIIEEDESSDLFYEESKIPTLKSMDVNNNVIYIYTFQFTFIPGLTMAFIVGDVKLIDCLSNVVSARLLSINWITQKLMARYLLDGKIVESMEEIRKLYKGKRDLMDKYLKELLPYGFIYSVPKGGVYYWCKLPKGITSKQIYNDAKREDISLIPGEIFYPNKNNGYDMIRLNFSYESADRIDEGMKKFVKIVKKSVLEHQKCI